MKTKIIVKVLSILLSLMIVISAVVLPAYADDGMNLDLLVAADLHMDATVTDISNRNKFDSNLYFHTTIQGQMDAESYAIIKGMLNEFVASDKQILLVAGDLTDGVRISHTTLCQLFAEAEAVSGKRIFVINGNHDIDDVRTEKYIDVDEFKEFYNEFGYGEALCKDENSCSYTAELDGNYRLLAIDSCIYGEDAGRISAETFAWIEAQVAAAKQDGKLLIGMMHHSLLPHFSVQSPMIDVEGGSYMTFASQLADMGVKYVFTGHIHANDISGATSDNGNSIYDVQTGSLITSPNAYRTVEFSSEQVDITTYYITKIDLDDLPAGYNDEQLDLIENDFATYSYGFFEAGMGRWLNQYIGSAHKVAKMFDIESGTPEYETLDKFMGILGDALNLPIYETEATTGELDSVEEIADSVGATLPESDYEYAYQLVAVLMGGFFHGDESIKSDDAEVQLLYAVMKSAVPYALGTIADTYLVPDFLSPLVVKLCGKEASAYIIGKIAEPLYAETIAGKIISSVLAPVIEGISSDFSEPADLNVTLGAYNQPTVIDGGAPLNCFIKIIKFILKVFEQLINTL